MEGLPLTEPNCNALRPVQFDLICRACERAAMMVAHTEVSLGAALDAACRREGIVLDSDSYAFAILSLSLYRARLEGRRQCPRTTGEQL